MQNVKGETMKIDIASFRRTQKMIEEMKVKLEKKKIKEDLKSRSKINIYGFLSRFKVKP